jgi:integrase/recombinase XerD
VREPGPRRAAHPVHESTQTTHIYEHADPALKEQAIARTAPLGTKPGRYRPPDALLAFLESL